MLPRNSFRPRPGGRARARHARKGEREKNPGNKGGSFHALKSSERNAFLRVALRRGKTAGKIISEISTTKGNFGGITIAYVITCHYLLSSLPLSITEGGEFMYDKGIFGEKSDVRPCFGEIFINALYVFYKSKIYIRATGAYRIITDNQSRQMKVRNEISEDREMRTNDEESERREGK